MLLIGRQEYKEGIVIVDGFNFRTDGLLAGKVGAEYILLQWEGLN